MSIQVSNLAVIRLRSLVRKSWLLPSEVGGGGGSGGGRRNPERDIGRSSSSIQRGSDAIPGRDPPEQDNRNARGWDSGGVARLGR